MDRYDESDTILPGTRLIGIPMLITAGVLDTLVLIIHVYPLGHVLITYRNVEIVDRIIGILELGVMVSFPLFVAILNGMVVPPYNMDNTVAVLGVFATVTNFISGMGMIAILIYIYCIKYSVTNGSYTALP